MGFTVYGFGLRALGERRILEGVSLDLQLHRPY